MMNSRLIPSRTDPGRHLFGFAVIADSHLEPEDDSGSQDAPRSNRRNRALVRRLTPLRPAFALHLGDIVHPVPQAPGHIETMSIAHSLYADLGVPVHWTPGNHDVGDKSSPTMPAAVVTDAWTDEYARVFGAPWQRVDHGAIVLLLLNSPVLNAGSATDLAQKRWLEHTLEACRGRRIFVATHYPPYLVDPDEDGHYDNIDRPARYWLLDLLRRYRVEALFCGHVHNNFYHRLDGTEIYLLPSPSFVRRDYSELYPVEASAEFGRNDIGKLGCYWVDVHEAGHVARFIRTEGAVDVVDVVDTVDAGALILPGHPKDPGQTPLTLHLRHPWSPRVELPHTPPVDEFARRVVRNDAPLQALWDLGIRHLRIPVGDLARPELQHRLAELEPLDMRATVFSAGLPSAELLDRLRAAPAVVRRWECVLPWHQAGALIDSAAAMVRQSGLTLMVSDLRSAAIGNAGRPAGKHFTAPGFSPGDLDGVAAGLEDLPKGVIGAVGIRFDRDGFDEALLPAILAFTARTGLAAVVTWTLMPYGPNDTALDEQDALDRVRYLVSVAERYPALEFALDDFMAIDRGYFPRVALVDRRADFSLAGRWLRDRRASEVAGYYRPGRSDQSDRSGLGRAPG